MTPTAWELRNTLIAILNPAQRSGKPFVDIEASDLDKTLNADRVPGLCRVVHGDIMTKMMRPGDTVLKDSQGGDDGIVIRYFFDANHNDRQTS